MHLNYFKKNNSKIATVDLIGDKIADKITKVLKYSQQNISETDSYK